MKRNKNGGSCGHFASGSTDDWNNNGALAGYLRGKYNVLRRPYRRYVLIYMSSGLGGSCSVGAGRNVCARLACADTTAAYLCNDNGFPIAPSCQYLYSYTWDIWKSCAFNGGFSGQEYDTDGYNVVLAYGNCNDPSNVRPDQYVAPGPNGDAWQCNGCVSPPCPRSQSNLCSG